MNKYKLGSLFDGSGGFPLAGTLCGIEPVWAAEIEPYPIAVTRLRFPNMKHLGDISKVNGAKIEPVDIITFGSPCQDLSVAGKRAGLKHEANGDEETTRSGLFMEAVRIIKEMRRATNGKYPRFALWENVPGAFSSNKGEDFKVVLEEIIKIVEPTAVMPEVPQKGWNYADSYSGDGWSLAYRVLDAQYWGVPQRRRRIYLVADLRGECARQVLFEREGLRGYFTKSRTPWEGTTSDAEGSLGADDCTRDGITCFTPWDSQTRRCYGINGVAPSLCAGADTSGQNQQSFLVPDSREDGVAYTLKIRSGCEGGGKGALVQKDKSATLATNNDQYLFQPLLVENHPADSRVNLDSSGKVQTLTSRMGTGGGNVPMLMESIAFAANQRDEVRDLGDKSGAIQAEPGMKQQTFIAEPICLQGNGIDRADTAGCNGKGWKEGASYTLNTMDRPAVVFALDQQGGKGGANYAENVMPTLCSDSHGTPHGVAYQDKIGSLCVSDYKGVGNQYVNDGKCVVESHPTYIVRRLTPTECARLQGFADGWGHIEKKKSLTKEELQFWSDVRNVHAAINGKTVKDYTEKQMLTWYNKLWTDSSEYKMWGNGIALPTALYVLQGITDALNSEATIIEDWML